MPVEGRSLWRGCSISGFRCAGADSLPVQTQIYVRAGGELKLYSLVPRQPNHVTQKACEASIVSTRALVAELDACARLVVTAALVVGCLNYIIHGRLV